MQVLQVVCTAGIASSLVLTVRPLVYRGASETALASTATAAAALPAKAAPAKPSLLAKAVVCSLISLVLVPVVAMGASIQIYDFCCSWSAVTKYCC